MGKCKDLFIEQLEARLNSFKVSNVYGILDIWSNDKKEVYIDLDINIDFSDLGLSTTDIEYSIKYNYHTNMIDNEILVYLYDDLYSVIPLNNIDRSFINAYIHDELSPHFYKCVLDNWYNLQARLII